MTNQRTDCPRCGGKNTYSVSTIDGKEKAQCFKAGCTLRYTKVTEVTCDDLNGWTKPKRTKEDYYWTDVLSNELAYRTLLEYNVDHYGINVRYDPARNRLVFIYKDQAVGRSLDGSSPKWYRYTDSVEPMFIVPRSGMTDHLVIVEDTLSALTVGQHVCSMALLGTDFQDSYYPYLTDHTKIFIALDKDATDKALDIAKDLCYIRPTQVTILNKDLKECNNEELIIYFNEWSIDYE